MGEENKKLLTLEGVVKCGRYVAGNMFVRLDDCEACPYYKGTHEIVKAVNGRPAVYDVLCGLPVHRRVEYVVEEEDSNGDPK